MRNYVKEHKVSLLWFLIAILVIFITSITQSLIQSAGGTITVSDLRNQVNVGTIQQKISYDDDQDPSTPDKFGTIETKVNGEVVSGILFKPKSATKNNPKPAVVLTHGYLNNRELQLPFAIELARRGYVVLTVDRQGHGNYNNTENAGAMMTPKGLYESTKYVYNLDYVDKTKIGITGHSMGGYSTAVTLMNDSINSKQSATIKYSDGSKTYNATAYGLGIIKAGLIQGWSTFITAGPEVSVGLLKAKDDEFFFKSTDTNGEPTISRQFLQSTGAAKFVGVNYNKGENINIQSGVHYVNGVKTNVELGTQIPTFRAIYEADEIHPLNHWSIPSTQNVIDFFYTALGTPIGNKVKGVKSQVWLIKETFSFIGMLALLSLIFPAVSLLLTIPFFKSLLRKRRKLVLEDGTVVTTETQVTRNSIDNLDKPLCKWYDYIFYFAPAIICTLVSGFTIKLFCTELGDRWFPNTQLFPQDTTNWVALWSAFCGVFALLIVLLVFTIRYAINKIKEANGYLKDDISNPFEVAKVSSFSNALKTILLAAIVIFGLYLIVFCNWGLFKVDFRLWTLVIKVFNVPEMLPTAIRYLAFFLIFYICSGIANQTYRSLTLPNWATTIINAFFNVFGISLVMLIQYGSFKSTGVLWQPEMNLGYIVLFPIVPILIFATIISRELYKKTGNIYLGSLINAMLFTLMTVTNTASSYAYIL